MPIGDRYKSTMAAENWDAVIIGSGISGLATARLLADAGKQVLVLEKHFKFGGYTHTFKRNNYEWDVGIHYIGGNLHKPNSFLRRLFDYLSNGNLHWARMDDIYDRMVFPDKTYDFITGKGAFLETMISYFPKEEKSIRNYIDLVDQVSKKSLSYYANKAIPGLLGSLAHPFMSKPFIKYAALSTKEVLTGLGCSTELIGVLTGQWGDYGLPPNQSSFGVQAMVARHYWEGGNYPVGGSRMIAETIIPGIQSRGGKVVLSTGVKEILTHKGKAFGVRLENGDEIKSNIVISSAGVKNTFEVLLKDKKIGSNENVTLDQVQPSSGYYCLHIGLNNTAADMGLNNANLWIYPDYDHDLNLENYLDDNDQPYPVVFISFPSAKDPSWDKNHPNTSTIEVITIAEFSKHKKWENKEWKNRGDEYEEFKESISKNLLDVLYQQAQETKDHVDYYELSTPLTSRDLANYKEGELYGINHTPVRFSQKWLKPQTPIKNLYLTGQDIVTAGVSAALMSGVITSSSILRKNLMKQFLN
jgi:all-trans-retinol 13,14-reductase